MVGMFEGNGNRREKLRISSVVVVERRGVVGVLFDLAYFLK